MSLQCNCSIFSASPYLHVDLHPFALTISFFLNQLHLPYSRCQAAWLAFCRTRPLPSFQNITTQFLSSLCIVDYDRLPVNAPLSPNIICKFHVNPLHGYTELSPIAFNEPYSVGQYKCAAITKGAVGHLQCRWYIQWWYHALVPATQPWQAVTCRCSMLSRQGDRIELGRERGGVGPAAKISTSPPPPSNVPFSCGVPAAAWWLRDAAAAVWILLLLQWPDNSGLGCLIQVRINRTGAQRI